MRPSRWVVERMQLYKRVDYCLAMRILFLTNFYPPAALGGQGNSCQQVVDGLQKRGHVTMVLTSNYRHAELAHADRPEILRSLFLEMDFRPWRHAIDFFLHRRRIERQNLSTFARCVEDYKPDVIFIWGMWNLHRSLPALAEQLFPNQVFYRFAEYWPTLPSQHVLYWKAPGRSWLSNLPKQIIGHFALQKLAAEPVPALQFPHAYCVSTAAKMKLVAAGIPVEHAQVIHTGIPVNLFRSDRSFEPNPDPMLPLKLISAGRLTAEKGVHTLLEAIGRLRGQSPQLKIELTLAGHGASIYTESLHELVEQQGLKDSVAFIGKVPGEQMPELFRGHDILVVPSIWDEPLARVILEGMQSGLAVIGTAIGGTPEIIVDNRNGLLFPPGDADALASAIGELARNTTKRLSLAQAGQNTVLERFTLDVMLDKIELLLTEAERTEICSFQHTARPS